MQITFTTPELERFVQDQVEDGKFATATDLIEAAVARLMLDPAEDVTLEDVRIKGIRRSMEQISTGQVRPLSEAADLMRQKHLGK